MVDNRQTCLYHVAMVDVEPSLSARDRLLKAADELFYDEGVHTVGIDRVLAHAGVAKASLYSTFGSKDELVREYLRGRDDRLRARIEACVARATDPRARILAAFDGLAERVNEGAYLGCAFMRACAEEPAGPSTAREVTNAHRSWRHDLFKRLAKDAGASDPLAMSRQLALLYDGAAVAASLDGHKKAPLEARRAAELLLDSETSALRRKGAKRAAARKTRTK
jgi:AcrR family transcriptional regulator